MNSVMYMVITVPLTMPCRRYEQVENQLVCNIPLALVAHILTSTQANEVAKEHNLHALSPKSLVEKQKAVESHVCTISCNRYVTMFKPVKKNQKSIRHQHSAKV